MIEAIKLRGSDKGLNLIIIDGVFHKVTPDLVSFEMVLTKEDISDAYAIGYSAHLKKIFIQFTDSTAYIYENVNKDIWQARHNYKDLLLYFNSEIKHLAHIDSIDALTPVTNEYVLEAYNKLEYWQTITDGLWCTDQPDKVIDTDDVLFQLDSSQ